MPVTRTFVFFRKPEIRPHNAATNVEHSCATEYSGPFRQLLH
jgi:hypothetical protein